MRFNVIGDNTVAKAVRAYLLHEGYDVSDAPSFLTYTLRIEQKQVRNVILDSVDCPLEQNIFNCIAELLENHKTGCNIVVQREGGVRSDREAKIVVPNDTKIAYLVELALFRALVMTTRKGKVIKDDGAVQEPPTPHRRRFQRLMAKVAKYATHLAGGLLPTLLLVGISLVGISPAQKTLPTQASGPGGGDSTSVNGAATVDINFGPNPVAPANSVNCLWQLDATASPDNASCYFSVFVGSGASHTIGLVPDPGAVAGTTKFLREDGTWQTPAGGTNHNLLSGTHSDTTTASAVRGDGMFAIGPTPTWQRLAHSAATGGYFKWNGTDQVASTGAAGGTGACGANNFETGDNADATPTCAQPGFTNLSGALTGASQLAKQDVMDSPSFCADAGANDTYACNLTPAVTAYVTGTHYRFKANTANTGPATINFNSVGAITIVKVAGGITTALADNDIRVGQWADLVYDGTNMQMQSTLGNAATGGTGDSITVGGVAVTDADLDDATPAIPNTDPDSKNVQFQQDGGNPANISARISGFIDRPDFRRVAFYIYDQASSPTTCGSTVIGDSCALVSATTTTVAMTASEPQYINFATSTVTGNVASASGLTRWMRGTGNNNYWMAWVKYVDTVNYRLWFCAMTDQATTTQAAADNPAGNYACFLSSSALADTDWRCVTKDNTTQNIIDSNVAPSTTAATKLEMFFDDRSVTKSITFKINGTSACSSPITANLPAVDTAMRYSYSMTCVACAAARNLRYARWYISSDH